MAQDDIPFNSSFESTQYNMLQVDIPFDPKRCHAERSRSILISNYGFIAFMPPLAPSFDSAQDDIPFDSAQDDIPFNSSFESTQYNMLQVDIPFDPKRCHAERSRSISV
jgi:hypothetical protein